MARVKLFLRKTPDFYDLNELIYRELVALNIYLGLCYYKLDYYDISQEALDTYLLKYPDSIIAINLKACNRFRLANGRAAENELKNLIRTEGIFGADLIKHNLVVFRNGEGALQILPKLIDVIPEARLNLTIYYLRSGEIAKAQELMNLILKPTIPSEYILKGVVHTLLAQKLDSVSFEIGLSKIILSFTTIHPSSIARAFKECSTILSTCGW